MMTIEHQCGCKVNIFPDHYENVWCDAHKANLDSWRKYLGMDKK